jgi:hypothetical protein
VIQLNIKIVSLRTTKNKQIFYIFYANFNKITVLFLCTVICGHKAVTTQVRSTGYI